MPDMVPDMQEDLLLGPPHCPCGQGHSPSAQVGRLSNSSVPDSLGCLRTHTKAGSEPMSVCLIPAVYTSCIHHAGALPGQEGTTLFP